MKKWKAWTVIPLVAGIILIFMFFSLTGCGKGGLETVVLPIILSVFPQDGITGVSTRPAVSATFSREMNGSTLNSSTFLLASAEGRVTGNVSYDAPSKTAVFSPQIDLYSNTTYVATVTAGAKDNAGSGMERDYAWSFSTVPMPAPTFYPTAGTYESAQTIAISSTIGADIYYTLDGSTPTIASTKYVNPFALTSSETVKAIAVKDGVLFSSVATAKYDIYSWQALGSGMDNVVSALAMDTAGNLYAGGSFVTAGGVAANHVARWNGINWEAIGAGLDGVVSAIVVDPSGNIYAGGNFLTAEGVTVNYIAKWNGIVWKGVGGGFNNSVSALALDPSGTLYAAGGFTSAEGNPAKYIAKWNGSNWSPLGSGMNYFVTSMAIDSSGNLYAGGAFTNAGGITANRIARWDGSSWSPLGLGLNGDVDVLAIDDSGNLYAGGQFSQAGGSSANRVAKWNGSNWSALGSGANNRVYALAADSVGNLFVGGEFSIADEIAVNYCAKWNGSSWSALRVGTNASIYEMKVDHQDNLYAGGPFIMAGGTVAANRIAKWGK